MKSLFGVAVFGLLPVPPMPACDAGAVSPDDLRAAAKDLEQFRLQLHANDKEQNAPAPDPVEDCNAEFTPDRLRG
jgi:hypothetical protein